MVLCDKVELLGKLRDRRGEVLFIDGRKLGTLVDRTRKEFSDDDVAKIAGVYHAWREGKGFEAVSEFCRAATLDEIKSHRYALMPGPYVGTEDAEDDDVPFIERFAALKAKLDQEFIAARKSEGAYREPQKADFVSKDQHRNLKAEIGLVPGHWTVAPLSKFVSRITYGFTNPMPSCRSCPPQPRR